MSHREEELARLAEIFRAVVRTQGPHRLVDLLGHYEFEAGYDGNGQPRMFIHCTLLSEAHVGPGFAQLLYPVSHDGSGAVLGPDVLLAMFDHERECHA